MIELAEGIPFSLFFSRLGSVRQRHDICIDLNTCEKETRCFFSLKV